MRVAVVQSGGADEHDLQGNVERLAALVRSAATGSPPAGAGADAAVRSQVDLVVLPELSTTPYFAGAAYDEAYRQWAPPVPGPTTDRIAEVCREVGTAVAFGMLERAEDGVLFNSLVFVNRRGEVVPGTMPDGRQVPAFRKLTAPTVSSPTLTVDEGAYCGRGPGPMVFDVDGVRYGAMICYDRAFSEVWLANRALGADVVVLAVSSLGWRESLFVDDLRLRAMEIGVFVVAANRGGLEECGGRSASYFGRSCIVAPDGEVLAEARPHSQPEVLQAELAFDRIAAARRQWPVWQDRRPDLYRFMYGG